MSALGSPDLLLESSMAPVLRDKAEGYKKIAWGVGALATAEGLAVLLIGEIGAAPLVAKGGYMVLKGLASTIQSRRAQHELQQYQDQNLPPASIFFES